MPADSIPHMPQLPSGTMIDRYYYHVGEHFMLISIPVIVSYLVSIEEDNLEVLY